jgi:Methyltransferase domain
MNLDDAYARIDSVLPNLPGWCTPEKGKRLARLAAALPGAPSCIELGVFGGRSLISIAFGLAVTNCGHVDGIDPFTAAAALEGTNDRINNEWWSNIGYDRIYETALGAVELNGLKPFASIIKQHSLDAVSRYKDGQISILHQDANHSAETSCAEVRAYTPKITPGGYWVSDDINWASTQKSQALLTESGFVLIETYRTWAIYQSKR